MNVDSVTDFTMPYPCFFTSLLATADVLVALKLEFMIYPTVFRRCLPFADLAPEKYNRSSLSIYRKS